jgi:membrane-bound lytic murein transglycosylase B
MRILRVVLISVTGVIVAAVVVGAIVILGFPGRSDVAGSGGSSLNDTSPVARFASAAPLVRAATPAAAGVQNLADPAWLAATAKATGIPTRALAAYAGVAIGIEESKSGCGLGWNTLAAIGEVESHHGTIFGGRIAANGDATPAIFGVSLSGGGVANIPDSDKGAIDGDATADRAVGPMQLIPEAWRNWHSDGNADGVQSPQNIDDATQSAAAYLCRAGGQKLGTEAGYRQAVLGYNSSNEYLDDIIRYATRYAKDAAH